MKFSEIYNELKFVELSKIRPKFFECKEPWVSLKEFLASKTSDKKQQKLKDLFQTDENLFYINRSINGNLQCSFRINQYMYTCVLDTDDLQFGVIHIDEDEFVWRLFNLQENNFKYRPNVSADESMSKVITAFKKLMTLSRKRKFTFSGVESKFGKNNLKRDVKGNTSRDRFYLYILKKYFGKNIDVVKKDSYYEIRIKK